MKRKFEDKSLAQTHAAQCHCHIKRKKGGNIQLRKALEYGLQLGASRKRQSLGLLKGDRPECHVYLFRNGDNFSFNRDAKAFTLLENAS